MMVAEGRDNLPFFKRVMPMDGEILENAVKLSIVLGFIGGVFSFFILRPLNSTITDLHKAVNELRNDLRACEERRHMMEIKLTEIDQRARSAHHRIDEITHVLRYGGGSDEGLEHR